MRAIFSPSSRWLAILSDWVDTTLEWAASFQSRCPSLKCHRVACPPDSEGSGQSWMYLWRNEPAGMSKGESGLSERGLSSCVDRKKTYQHYGKVQRIFYPTCACMRSKSDRSISWCPYSRIYYTPNFFPFLTFDCRRLPPEFYQCQHIL